MAKCFDAQPRIVRCASLRFSSTSCFFAADDLDISHLWEPSRLVTPRRARPDSSGTRSVSDHGRYEFILMMMATVATFREQDAVVRSGRNTPTDIELCPCPRSQGP